MASRGRPGVSLTPFLCEYLISNLKSQFDSPSRRLFFFFCSIFFLSFFFLNFILLAYVSPRGSSSTEPRSRVLRFRSSHRVQQIQNGKETSGFQDRPQTSLSEGQRAPLKRDSNARLWACDAVSIPSPDQSLAPGQSPFSDDMLKIGWSGSSRQHLSAIDIPGIFITPTY